MKKIILFVITALFVITSMGFAQTGTNAAATFYMTLDATAPTTAGTEGDDLVLWSTVTDYVYLRIYAKALVSYYSYSFRVEWNSTEFEIESSADVTAANSTYEANIIGTPSTWLVSPATFSSTDTYKGVLVVGSASTTANGLMTMVKFKKKSTGTGAGNAVFIVKSIEVKEDASTAAVLWPDNAHGGTANTIAAVQDAGPIIPVELSAFTVNAVSTNNMNIEWSTASETNNYGFEIERSSDGITFNKIGFVEGNGTTTKMHNYSYADENLNSGDYYYRLKQIDFDGSYKYSEVIKAEIQTPDEYGLEQNYPNPFNPVTTIPFRIKDAGRVQIKVYNILGQEVATIVDRHVNPGFYRESYNAARLGSGVYFYRMTVNGKSLLKRFVLVK